MVGVYALVCVLVLQVSNRKIGKMRMNVGTNVGGKCPRWYRELINTRINVYIRTGRRVERGDAGEGGVIYDV